VVPNISRCVVYHCRVFGLGSVSSTDGIRNPCSVPEDGHCLHRRPDLLGRSPEAEKRSMRMSYSYTRDPDPSGSLEGAGGHRRPAGALGRLFKRQLDEPRVLSRGREREHHVPGGRHPSSGCQLPLRPVWQFDFQERHLGRRQPLPLFQQGVPCQQRGVLLPLPVLRPQYAEVVK
jgi:hypothetical protein